MTLTKSRNRMTAGASVNVLDYGAVGNGVTDDTAAFNAAWSASNPKAVLVPVLSYKITGTVTGTFFSFGAVTVVGGTVTTITNTTSADTDTVYTHPNHTGEVTSTADGATVIAANIVDEANLKVSNAPTNGYFLSAQSANTGGLTWAVPTGLTAVTINKTVSGYSSYSVSDVSLTGSVSGSTLTLNLTVTKPAQESGGP